MADELTLAPADGLRVTWDRAALAALPTRDATEQPGWRLDGSLEPAFDALRVLSGAATDGSLLALCAARPTGARNHDADAVAAAVVDPEGNVHEIEEALVSTEYGADGRIRRLGLELYRSGNDYPLRAAGDAVEASSGEEEHRDFARLRFRLDGSDGVAVCEIVRRV